MAPSHRPRKKSGMAATTERVDKRSHAGIIVLAIVLLGLVVAAAYYQQEISNYMRLQGWDTAAVRQTMERFVREAHEGQSSAGELLDTTWVQPVVEGGK